MSTLTIKKLFIRVQWRLKDDLDVFYYADYVGNGIATFDVSAWDEKTAELAVKFLKERPEVRDAFWTWQATA